MQFRIQGLNLLKKVDSFLHDWFWFCLVGTGQIEAAKRVIVIMTTFCESIQVIHFDLTIHKYKDKLMHRYSPMHNTLLH